MSTVVSSREQDPSGNSEFFLCTQSVPWNALAMDIRYFGNKTKPNQTKPMKIKIISRGTWHIVGAH